MEFANRHKKKNAKLNEQEMCVFTRVKFQNVRYHREKIFTTNQYIRE